MPGKESGFFLLMKPKTKEHFKLLRLSPQLSELKKRDTNRVFKDIFSDYYYPYWNKAVCSHCAYHFESPFDDVIKCKKCKRKLNRVNYKTSRNEYHDVNYFAHFEILEDYQVLRYFEMIKSFGRKQKAKYEIREVTRYWIHVPTGKMTLESHITYANYHSIRDYFGDMEFRKDEEKYKLELTGLSITDSSEFHPILYRNGFNGTKPDEIHISDHVSGLLGSRIYESLYKLGNEDLLKMANSKFRDKRYKKKYEFILRMLNKRKPDYNMSLYFDYINWAIKLGWSLSDQNVIFPKNLIENHDKAMEEYRVYLQSIAMKLRKGISAAEEELIKAKTKEYKRFIEPYKDFKIIKGKITIMPLMTVEEFKEEGDELHHCVYANKYYDKYKSLILSAKVNGKRAETIEWNLVSGKIMQAYGNHHEFTKYHEEFKTLVNNRKAVLNKLFKNGKIEQRN